VKRSVIAYLSSRAEAWRVVLSTELALGHYEEAKSLVPDLRFYQVKLLDFWRARF
jgi:hypothetical protein